MAEAGTTKTNRLPATLTIADPPTTSCSRSQFIHSWSAEMKTSAGAPLRICGANLEVASKLNLTSPPPASRQALARVGRTSCRLEAASTRRGFGSCTSARTGWSGPLTGPATRGVRSKKKSPSALIIRAGG